MKVYNKRIDRWYWNACVYQYKRFTLASAILTYVFTACRRFSRCGHFFLFFWFFRKHLLDYDDTTPGRKRTSEKNRFVEKNVPRNRRRTRVNLTANAHRGYRLRIPDVWPDPPLFASVCVRSAISNGDVIGTICVFDNPCKCEIGLIDLFSFIFSARLVHASACQCECTIGVGIPIQYLLQRV